MSRTGRAVVAHGRDFDVREYPVPDPEPGTLLLRQEMAGICGTDLHNWQNGIEGEMLLGHENVGIVEALGKGVDRDYLGREVREGDRIAFAPGTPHGAYGFQRDPDTGPHFGGGFADFIYLAYADTCFLRTEAPREVAVLLEPFTVGVHAVMRGQVGLGDTVVVQGSGAIGLVTVACARLSGAARIVVVGGPAGRLDLARRLGADVTLDIEQSPTAEERIDFVRSECGDGKGADVVFECAGFLPATPEGLAMVRFGGTFVEVGHFVDMGTVELNLNQSLMRRNLRLEAIWGSRPEHFARGLPLLERGDFPYAEMVSHVLPLDRVRDGFEALDGSYRLDDRTAVKIALAADE